VLACPWELLPSENLISFDNMMHCPPWINHIFVLNYSGFPNNCCWPWTIYLCGYRRRSL